MAKRFKAVEGPCLRRHSTVPPLGDGMAAAKKFDMEKLKSATKEGLDLEDAGKRKKRLTLVLEHSPSVAVAEAATFSAACGTTACGVCGNDAFVLCNRLCRQVEMLSQDSAEFKIIRCTRRRRLRASTRRRRLWRRQ